MNAQKGLSPRAFHGRLRSFESSFQIGQGSSDGGGEEACGAVLEVEAQGGFYSLLALHHLPSASPVHVEVQEAREDVRALHGSLLYGLYALAEVKPALYEALGSQDGAC